MEDRYAFWILQKDVLITVEGYFKPEEWTDSKSGEKRNRIVMVATKDVYKRQAVCCGLPFQWLDDTGKYPTQ